MTIKTFWTIFLKILGLWFLFVSLSAIATLFSFLFIAFQNVNSPGIEKFLLAFSFILLCAGFFIFILWLLVFKTAWVIEKFKLTKDFSEEKLELNMEWSTIMTIATIVIGGIIFIDSIPLLCKQLYSFFQKGTFFKDTQESIWIIFYFVKALLGYLLMTNSRYVVNFIVRQNIKNEIGEI
ncbi:MAG: hypothetical protein WCK18_00530 [Prolixibacteraceae bacterium]